MNVDNRAFLTNEQQLELREYESLFNSPAWSWIVEDAKQQLGQLTDYIIKSAMTEGDMRESRGMIKTLEQLIYMKEARESFYNMLIDDAELNAAELRESAGANS